MGIPGRWRRFSKGCPMKQNFSFQASGNYIHGSFRIPSMQTEVISSVSPANLQDTVGDFATNIAEVELAVESASQAFKKWKRLKLEDRINFLMKFQEIVAARQEEFAHLIAREVGKPLWEARTEVKGVIGKVTISLNEGLQQVKDISIEDILPNTEGVMSYRPLGVLAVLGPFNFPAHLPNGHIVPALLSGNSVVFKPSEKTPAVGQFLVECFDQAGLPPGVINLVQGGVGVSKALAEHDDINGVLFTGSYNAGKAIKQATIEQPWKLLALEMGGKNSAIVWEDADLDTALYETLTGAFMTSGQRCSATGKILVHYKLLDEFVNRFVGLSESLVVGHPMEKVFMGPVIDSHAKNSILAAVKNASESGFENPVKMTEVKLEYEGHYLSPAVFTKEKMSLQNVKSSQYLQAEIFGPETLIMGVDSLDSAIAIANASPFGLVGSVFTKSADIFEECWWELETGLVNWNKSTVGASSKLPFGGLKASGNHFPTALHAGRYCNAAITSMKVAQSQGKGADLPGLKWS